MGVRRRSVLAPKSLLAVWVAICAVSQPVAAQPHGRSPGKDERPATLGAAVSERPTGTGRRVYTLEQLLGMAEANYPKVREAEARLRIKKHQVWEARTAPFSEFTVKGGVGVAPTLMGTSVYSPSNDVALTENMALALQIGVEGMIPLWTFGKITSLWEAADANVQLGRHEVEKEKNAIRFDVRRAYYGVLLARDSRILLNRATKNFDEHIAKMEAEVAAGEGDDIELLKMKMQRAELRARGTEADKGERTALAGLRFFCGADAPIDVPDIPLEPIAHPLADVVTYLQAAKLYRPEVNMAKAGVMARKAQVELAKARLYPDFGLGVEGTVVRAAEVTDQRNPFTRDPANRAFFALGIVFRWKLDLLPQAAKLAQAQAQLDEVRATERYALGGIAAEVERAYAEAAAAKERLDAWTDATSYAKRWLIKVQQGMDLGLADADELVEPSKAYALHKASEMEALYQYNLAMSQLAQATGWEEMLH